MAERSGKKWRLEKRRAKEEKKAAKQQAALKAAKKGSRKASRGKADQKEKQKEEKRISAQRTIAYKEMAKDGICRVHDKCYSKTIRFSDINYQLAQNDDKNAIFENWCDFLNYFDSSIHFQLSFINQKSSMKEFEKVIRIRRRHDEFDEIRREYARMLHRQLAKGNNGLVKSKYITFSIEADNIREAKPKLERIETDILNNFKILGVPAEPLNGAERLKILRQILNPDELGDIPFDYGSMVHSGLSTKDYVAPTGFVFKDGKTFQMGNTIGAVSYLQILAPLDELMAADPDFNKEDYFQASFTQIEGGTYLMPVNTQAFYLFYNKTMFEQAGLTPPTSWEEIVSCARQLTDPDKNQYGFTVTMAEQEASNGSILFFYPLLYAQNGRTLVDGQYTVQTEEMYNALDLLRQLNEDGSLLPGTTTKSEVQMVEEFSVGNVGMMISNDSHIKTVTDRNPELDFGVVPIPTMDGTGTPELRHHGWDIAISESCEHKQEAWEFISFLCEKENMQSYCNAALKLPAAYGVTVDYLDEYPVVQDVMDIVNTYDMVEELMVMPKASACWVDLTKAGSAVVQGAQTVDDALAQTQELWNEKLGQ